jgi:hypothetical protein
MAATGAGLGMIFEACGAPADADPRADVSGHEGRDVIEDTRSSGGVADIPKKRQTPRTGGANKMTCGRGGNAKRLRETSRRACEGVLDIGETARVVTS